MKKYKLIKEDLLLEKSRQELINKSKNSDVVKSYGTTRYGRKDFQHVENTTRNLNRIDFNALFKADLLSVIIPVQGETNNYDVEIFFDEICTSIRQQVKSNNNVCEYKCIYKALISAINHTDIFISCTCPDFKFRHAYYASKGRYNAGQPQIVPSKVTNPNDTKGAGCKHAMKVLADLDWVLNLATCINNYITYMKDNYEDKYANIIFPAIYGMSYDKGVQLGLFDNPEDDELANTMDNPEDEEEINKANDSGEETPEDVEIENETTEEEEQ